MTFEGFSKRFEKENTVEVSSVAWGRGRRGGYCLPHWLGNQNAEYEKYLVFSTSARVVCTGIDSKNDLKHILKRLFRGRD